MKIYVVFAQPKGESFFSTYYVRENDLNAFKVNYDILKIVDVHTESTLFPEA